MWSAIEKWLQAGHKVAVVYAWGLEVYQRRGHLTAIQTFPHDQVRSQSHRVWINEAAPR